MLLSPRFLLWVVVQHPAAILVCCGERVAIQFVGALGVTSVLVSNLHVFGV